MTPWAALRSATVTYSRRDLSAVTALAVVVAIWAGLAGAGFSFGLLIGCEALLLTFYLVGSLVASVGPLARGVLFDLALRLLIGYAVVSALLFALAWVSPLGIVLNFVVISSVALLVFFGAGRRERDDGGLTGAWVLALCVVAASLWCQDSLRPTVEQGSQVVFKPWVDGFYHAFHIRMFGAAHGAGTIEDFRLAGIPARPYHYGVYLAPAFIKQLSGVHSYPVFAGILAPLGVLFTGLSAYAFAGTLWGPWSGVLAAAVLLLLPDGSQQGVHNTFMSYHWLTQISPSATYGLALLGVAWLFILRGCEEHSWPKLLAGWFAAALLLLFKLHYVVASAFLLLLVPALFFGRGIGPLQRTLRVLAAGALYVTCLWLGQRVPGVPLIRFDGSAVGDILRLVLQFTRSGAVNDYVRQHTGAQAAWSTSLLFGVPYVLAAVLGCLLPLLLGLTVALRRRLSLLALVFPLMLIANFLIMFFGLALDVASSTPDELSHRPLMIVYFFSAAWSGGALGVLLGGVTSRLVKPLVSLVTAALLLVPAKLGVGVQLMPSMHQLSPLRVSSDVLRVAEHIRTRGGPDDVIQASRLDRIYAFAALSERRSFVTNTLTRMPYRAELVEQRITSIERFMRLRKPQAIVGAARGFGFRWFILEDGDRVDWPAEILENPVLVAGPLRLYEF